MSARRLNLGARIRARSQSVRVLVENALRIDVDGMIRRGCLRPGVHIEGEFDDHGQACRGGSLC
jgi:hypothetical protein